MRKLANVKDDFLQATTSQKHCNIIMQLSCRKYTACYIQCSKLASWFNPALESNFLMGCLKSVYK